MDFPLLRYMVSSNVASALMEDMGTGDLSAQLVPDYPALAQVVAKERCVLCGQPWFNAAFYQLDENIKIEWAVKEGDTVTEGTVLCVIRGKARSLLTAERTALNFLQTLSGTATLVRRFVEAIAGTSSRIVDTRKTLPGLRHAQKYAVWVAGGVNHRQGLYDGILIKENHIMAGGGILPVLTQAQALQKQKGEGTLLQIEVETLDQLEEALQAGAKLILLDNFDIATLRQAVQHNAGRAILEASGNITLDNVRLIADTGVDRISIGSLTKHVKAVDLSMRFFSQTESV
jgi:nicotinate-nucleotide pyrophosphorylase (carboxylating)